MGKGDAVLFSISWNACIRCGVCIAICPQELPFVSDFDTIAVHIPCDIACMICETICPVSAITSERMRNGFFENTPGKTLIDHDES